MAYRVEVGSRADIQLKQLDAVVGAAVERKIMWLSKNAAVMVHRRLVGMLEPQFVDVVDDLAKIVTALNLVLNLAEDFADFVFDCVWTGCFLLEALEIGKELLINEVPEVVTGHRFVVIEFPVSRFRRGPLLPAIWLFENEVIFATIQLCLSRTILLQSVEVFQEEQPRSLLDVIQLGRAARF